MIKFYSRPKLGIDLVIADKISKNCWVFVEDPNSNEIDYLVKNLKLDEGLILDSVDTDEAPRVEVEDGVLYVFSRFAYTNSKGIIKTAPVMFAITKSNIITVAVRRRSIFKQFADDNANYATANKMDILANLLRISIESYSYRLNSISRQVRSIRSNLSVDKLSNKDFIQLVEVGDVLNEFLGDIVPINNVLQVLSKNKQNPKFNEEDLDLLEDLYLSANQLLDNSKSALKTIVNIRDSYANIATNNLNKKITLLTTLTVVLTIPTIVGSFWGMNVNVPFKNSTDSFLIIISVTLLLVSLTLAWLKTKKWF